MTVAESWKTRLHPWAERWWELQRDIETWVRKSTDDELVQIEDDATSPRSTNCWFATFEVAHQVREAVNAERCRRPRAATADPLSRPGESA